MDFHKGRPLSGVFLEEGSDQPDDFGGVTRNNLADYQVSDYGEVDLSHAGIVAEIERILKGQTLENDHADPEGIASIEIYFRGSLSE